MENKLTEGELVEQMKRCWHLYSLPESKINQQAYNQLIEIVKEHFKRNLLRDKIPIVPKEVKRTINSMASEIVKLQEQQKPTVSREEKEGMIKMFEEMCMFMAVRGFIREDERAVNIKKLPDGLEVTNGE